MCYFSQLPVSDYCLYYLPYLTLPYMEGVLPPSAQASNGPNAHPRINRNKVTKSPSAVLNCVHTNTWNHPPPKWGLLTWTCRLTCTLGISKRISAWKHISTSILVTKCLLLLLELYWDLLPLTCSDISVFEIILVLVFVMFGLNHLFQFQFLYSIHNVSSFCLYIVILRSFQLSFCTVFLSFPFQFSVNSKQLICRVLSIQVIHRITME